MKRIGASCVLALLFAGVCAPRAGAAARYSSAVVAPAVRSAEPKVFVDSRTHPATIYVAAPASSTRLWRSTDGGRTFKAMAATQGGSGDSDVVVDDKGVLYAADLFNASGQFSFPVSTSFDRGRSYARIVEAAPGQQGLDRQWIASNGAGHVLGTARNDDLTLLAWVSTDAALTFDGPFVVARNITIQGPIVSGPGHVYYTIYGAGDGIHYARSRDGIHWITGLVAAGHASSLFPVIAVDKASDLFAVWSEDAGALSGGLVYFARSTNGGRSWSRPAALSPTRPDGFGTTRSTVFPWVVAGGKGKVAVSYAIARQSVGPDVGSDGGGPQTSWDLMVAQTSNALAARPAWSTSVAARGFHQGSICTGGTSCVGPQQFGFVNVPTPFDRRDLDFAGAGADASGNVYVAFNRDRPQTSGNPNDVVTSQTDIVLARQTGGPKLR
jgi:hypothetical protein